MRPVAELLRSATLAYAQKTAIRIDDRAVTYQDLEDTARQIAALDVASGDRVALRIAQKDAFISTSMGIIRSGAIAVPLDRIESEQQTALIEDSMPSVIIHDDSLALDRNAFPSVRFMDVSKLSEAGGKAPAPVSPDDPCLMLYTSGTLGTRKGVLLSQANLAATVRYMTDFMGLDDTLVEYVGSPIDHAFGYGRCRAVLASGGTLVLDDQDFNPIRALTLIEREKCNSIAMAATGMAMLVEHFSRQLAKLGDQIRWVELGSVPMRTELMDRLVDLLPAARIVMNYGMTEAQRSTMIDFRAERTMLGTVGRASPECAARVRGETGDSVTDTPGVVEVAGPHVALGYWGREDLWHERLTDGWFETDDLGSIDAQGYITFIGRRDDMINVGGDKISPVEIEHLIGPRLGDTTFCVCATNDPNGLYGETPVICIEYAGSDPAGELPDWKTLRQDMAATVPANMLPQRAVAVETLPRTGNGKIQRRLLREKIEAGACTEI